MLASLGDPDWPEREGAWHGAEALARQRWSWAPLVQPRLSRPDANDRWLFARLPDWGEGPPRGPPRRVTIDAADVAGRLDRESAVQGKGVSGRCEPGGGG